MNISMPRPKCLIYSLYFMSLASLITFRAYSQESLDDSIPVLSGLNIESLPVAPDGDPLELPAPLQEVLQDRLNQISVAPAWVQALRSKTLINYFKFDSTGHISPQNLDQGRQILLSDATRLHQYFESNDNTGLYKDFVQTKLQGFIKSIDEKTLTSATRHGRITRPLKEWTVETLVVTEQVAYLGRFPRFIKNTLNLITGRHLKGASAIAGVIALGAIGAHLQESLHLSTIALVAGGALAGAFQAGPLAAILNSATSWFIQPTTEFIRLISARYTGPLEQKINHAYDKLKPRSIGTLEAPRNESPNIPSAEKDGMDFAGMSAAEQEQNWTKNLRMWVAVAKTFGQLLRDTHHTGRVLMMISWSDEQLTTVLVETMDSKLLSLAIKAETLLTPYKTAILANATLDADSRLKAFANLEANFDLYQKLNERKWLDLDLNQQSLERLEGQISETKMALKASGMSDRSLQELEKIQKIKMKSVSTIVTALTLNEIRSFNVAEANRNLESEARQAQRAIRNGFHLQDYVNQYREHVQQFMEAMGYKNSRKPLISANGTRLCEKALL